MIQWQAMIFYMIFVWIYLFKAKSAIYAYWIEYTFSTKIIF